MDAPELDLPSEEEDDEELEADDAAQDDVDGEEEDDEGKEDEDEDEEDEDSEGDSDNESVASSSSSTSSSSATSLHAEPAQPQPSSSKSTRRSKKTDDVNPDTNEPQLEFPADLQTALPQRKKKSKGIWTDPSDELITVNVDANRRTKKLGRGKGDPQISGVEFEKRLRAQYVAFPLAFSACFAGVGMMLM